MSQNTATPSTGLDPATFDLDAWLDGVKRPRAQVTIYARGDLMPRIDELVGELELLNQRRKQAEQTDVPLAEVGGDAARAEELRIDLAAIWEEYEASGVTFELEQISAADVDEITALIDEQFPDLDVDAPAIEQARIEAARNDTRGHQLISRSVKAIGPYGQPGSPIDLPVEKVAELNKRFGPDQIGELAGQAHKLTFEGQVSVPFSRRVSATLTESTSE